jgi:hypothetical protein
MRGEQSRCWTPSLPQLMCVFICVFTCRWLAHWRVRRTTLSVRDFTLRRLRTVCHGGRGHGTRKSRCFIGEVVRTWDNSTRMQGEGSNSEKERLGSAHSADSEYEEDR